MHPPGNPALAGTCEACGANLGAVNCDVIRAAREAHLVALAQLHGGAIVPGPLDLAVKETLIA